MVRPVYRRPMDEREVRRARQAVADHVGRPVEEVTRPVVVDGIYVMLLREGGVEGRGVPARIGSGCYLFSPVTGKAAVGGSLPPRVAVSKYRHRVD